MRSGRHVPRSGRVAFVPRLALVLIRVSGREGIARLPPVRGHSSLGHRLQNGPRRAPNLAAVYGPTERQRRHAGEICLADALTKRASRRDLARARQRKWVKARDHALRRVARRAASGPLLVRDHPSIAGQPGATGDRLGVTEVAQPGRRSGPLELVPLLAVRGLRPALALRVLAAAPQARVRFSGRAAKTAAVRRGRHGQALLLEIVNLRRDHRSRGDSPLHGLAPASHVLIRPVRAARRHHRLARGRV